MRVKNAQLYEVSEKNNSIAVIFVHGLGGHPIKTWRKNELSKSLPELLRDDVALNELDFYSYGYVTGKTTSKYDFTDAAELLSSDIQAQLKNKDIVFVAHSMGGLIVQKYIINLIEKFDMDNLKKLKGAVYLSVPFQGSKWASMFSKVLVNKQIKSMRKANPLLVKLENSWQKYFFRGGDENLPDILKHTIPQIAFHGAQDQVVSNVSASPLYIGAKIYKVDQNHRSICKVDEKSSVFKSIKNFLADVKKTSEPEAMILHVHGYEKQEYPIQPDVELDWTKYFDSSAKPRVLPKLDEWSTKLSPQLKLATETWSQNWVKKGGRVRIYAKLCLPGGLLIGNRFSRTKGAIVEVEHYNQMWSSEKVDNTFKAITKRTPGNNSQSKRAIIVLSVTSNIQPQVEKYLEKVNEDYCLLVNISPPNGADQESIKNNEEAVAYAKGVKAVADDLNRQGIEEVYLFLNCPFSVAVFVGHHLTATCHIQVFDYVVPDYTLSCRL
ncbi:alpha/beta fold hydrolase [Priestia koreensis]|uniref:alpha/beta fold hydrolase n=1 Tax=Priestia koreensis TaxID=284581 RepID=UPI00301A7B05